MNRVGLIGRLIKEPEVRYTKGENPICIANFILAVDKKFKRENQPTADFITCKAFGKTAMYIEKYIGKGAKIGVEGSIETGSYEKDGVKKYTVDVVAETVEFCEGGKSNIVKPDEPIDKPSNDGFMNVVNPALEEELPFC